MPNSNKIPRKWCNKHFFFLFSMFCLLLLTLYTSTVSAYDASTGWPADDSTSWIQTIETVYIISENYKDATLEVNIQIGYEKNYTAKHPNIYFSFNPWESFRTQPPTNFEAKICAAMHSSNFDRFDETCRDKNFTSEIKERNVSRTYIAEDGKIDEMNTTKYTFVVTNFSDRYGGWFTIFLRYDLKDFIREEGDLYAAIVSHQNLDDVRSLKSWFHFPTQEAIPVLPFPDDVRPRRFESFRDDKAVSHWVFEFEGDADRTFFFQNPKQIEQKEEKLQSKYMWRGFWLAFIPSLTLLVMELAFEEEIKKLLKPYKKKALNWLKRCLFLKEKLGRKGDNLRKRKK